MNLTQKEITKDGFYVKRLSHDEQGIIYCETSSIVVNEDSFSQQSLVEIENKVYGRCTDEDDIKAYTSHVLKILLKQNPITSEKPEEKKKEKKIVMVEKKDEKSEIKETIKDTKERSVDTSKTLQQKLINASINGDRKIVSALLKSGADVNKPDHDGTRALAYACRHGHGTVTQYLVGFGANVNLHAKYELTPLMEACVIGDWGIAEFLLKNGAKVDDSTWVIPTPLMLAAENGHMSIIRLLLRNGANVEGENPRGTAFELARKAGHLNISLVLGNSCKVAWDECT